MLLRYGLLLGLSLSLIALADSALKTGWFPVPWYGTVLGAAFLLLGWQLGAWATRQKPAAASSPQIAMPEEKMAPADVPSCESLSDREAEVLRFLAEGLSNREIGNRLFISENTVKTHLQNLYSKLGVQRRTQAVARARALGLIP